MAEYTKAIVSPVYIIQETHHTWVDMAEKEKEKVLTSLADVEVGMKLEAMDKYGKWWAVWHLDVIELVRTVGKTNLLIWTWNLSCLYLFVKKVTAADNKLPFWLC